MSVLILLTCRCGLDHATKRDIEEYCSLYETRELDPEMSMRFFASKGDGWDIDVPVSTVVRVIEREVLEP